MNKAKKSQKSQKINTVNVIEYSEGSVLGIHSFNDNEAGNKEAEKRFMELAKENIDVTPRLMLRRRRSR